ncbi:MAG: trypsin-like peptidase domain-containing protein [Actinomycetes bacterium]
MRNRIGLDDVAPLEPDPRLNDEATVNDFTDDPTDHEQPIDAIDASSHEVDEPAAEVPGADAWTAGPAGVEPPADDAYRVAADAFDPPTEPVDHWGPPRPDHAVGGHPADAPATAVVPLAPGATSGSAPAAGRGRQFIAGIAIGALVGGLVGGGVAALTARGETRVVQSPNPVATEARNTSRLAVVRDIQGIVGRVEPAVVAIRTGRAVDEGLFSGNGGSSGGEGTGFVIDPSGVIVTNDHVIDGAGGRIEVVFNDGTIRRAKVLGRSAQLDLAVIRAENVAGLPTARLGSSEDLVVGDDVVAIGNALALDGSLSVTRGIISAKGRTVDTDQRTSLFNMLQTDAAINPGNSGGPLLNSRGEVVGINTAIANPSEAQNVGFAIAIDSARPIIDQLREGSDVRLAYLGVQTRTVTPATTEEESLTTQSGAIVIRVEPGTAAAEAGIRRGDVIVAIDGVQVRRADDVGSAIRGHRPGEEIELTIERDRERKVISVRLGSVPLSQLG